MPQMIAIGLVGVLGYYAWRVFRREMARVAGELEKQKASSAPQEAAQLEKGSDGVYRPRNNQPRK